LDSRIEESYGGRGLHILKERYTRRGETPAQAMWRVCKCVAAGDLEWATTETDVTAQEFMNKLLVPNRFLPNTPTWTGAGVGKGQLAACFVLPIEDNMESIFGTLRDAALIQSTGGGTGFSFGHLRPAGATIQSSQGTSSGAVSFIGAYDAVFNAVQQGG
jgi:ribonucleoside-diphosphate reductase alpha chain